MTVDHFDDVPGWPASPTAVSVDPRRVRVATEHQHAREYRREREQQKKEARAKWLSEPGNLEKKREAQRRWKRKNRLGSAA